MKTLLNICGWIGILLVMCAYALISFSVIDSNDISYQLLNLFGASGIVFSSYAKKDMQPVVLNIFWGLIALTAILKIL